MTCEKIIADGDDTLTLVPCVKEDLCTSKILVIGLVRNIENNITHLKYFINELKTLFANVSFFYLTNNTKQSTVTLMKQWSDIDECVSGIVIPDEIVQVRDRQGNIGNRVQMLAKYRNMLFHKAKEHYGIDYDYLLQLDTDLIANISAKDFMTCFDLRSDFDAICANGVFRNTIYHYDLFALRLLNEPWDINRIYPSFNKSYGIDMKWLSRMVIINKWTRVKSGWGGMMLYPKKIFGTHKLYEENIAYDECEHIALCRKLEKIYVNPNLTYMQEYDAEVNCFDAPKLFVPRDAGFFSVFNFYIGMLTMCGRIYPFWNYAKFVQMNRTHPKHFCYFNMNNKNSWFEFFDKVEFYKDDNTNVGISSFMTHRTHASQGCEAPEEFRVPEATKRLLDNTDKKLASWRRRVHKIFKTYIKPSENLQNLINEKKAMLFDDDTPTIGVHFRHPSHCCEQGIILLEDYYKCIDNILKNNPNANIYLATDTDFGIAAFQKKYGHEKIKYIPEITRTSFDNILEWAYARGSGATDSVGFINNKGYELQHVSAQDNRGNPKLAMDVLLEVYCLSECNWFVHTLSNVALAVSYFNPELTMIKVK